MRTYNLQASSSGADTSGTFSIYYDTVTNSTQVLLDYNVPKASIIAGYTIFTPDDVQNVYLTNEGGFCNCVTSYLVVPGLPTPTPTTTPNPTATPTATPIPTATPTGTPTPSVTGTPTPTPSVTGTPTPTPTVTGTPTPTVTGTPTPTPSVTGTPTPTPTVTGTPTPTPTATVTPTPTPSETPIPVYTFSLGYSVSSGLAACSDYSTSPANYYSYNPTFTNGTVLYTNFTFPLSGNAITGYYSDGTDQGFAPGNSGVVNGVISCLAPTPTPSPTATPFPTPTPAPFEQSVRQGITISDACNAVNSPITLQGNNVDFCSMTAVNSQAFITFANGNYYIAYSGQTIQIQITGAPTVNATVISSGCTACPTPVPTVTPTPTVTGTPTPTLTPSPTPTPSPTLTPIPTPTVTPIPAITYTLTAGVCSSNGTVSVTISGVSGGISGLYDVGSTYYTSQAAALATTSYVTGIFPYQYNGVPADGEKWFVVRDRNNTTIKSAQSISLNCPTPTPTAPPPTATPEPTTTPAPTGTPIPTSTPAPTATPNPSPTPTFIPTPTATPPPPTGTPFPTNTPGPTATPTPTVTVPPPTATPVPPVYNYYTFTPCNGGAGTDYRSVSSLTLNDVYAFLPPGQPRPCYEITSIAAAVNTNDLPTIYGPKSGCGDSDCQQL
jgi:hypothetical protein